MSAPLSPNRIIGNLAAVIGVVLLGGLLADLIAGWAGFHLHAFCSVLQPVTTIAHQVGVILTVVDIIIWAASLGKSQAGIGLAVGGVLLFVMPLVLPHYLGAACLS